LWLGVFVFKKNVYWFTLTRKTKTPGEMKKWALHFLISMLYTHLSANAQIFDYQIAGAGSAALGHASAALSGAEALFHNQAGIATVKNLSFILSCESRYLMKELSLLAAGVVIPTGSGTFGTSIVRFGTGAYRNNHISLAYAKELGRFVSAAVAFDFLSVRLPENSRPFSATTVECGVISGIPGKWKAGAHIFNPVMAKINLPHGKVAVPWRVRTGFAWNLTPFLMQCNEVDFRPDKPPSLHTGLEFSPYPEVSIRAGITGNPPECSLGAGFRMGKMVFDISFTYHGYLGFTPVAGITFQP
jgi:hypothetical protein